MAPEFVTQRDGSGFGDQLPPGQTIQLDHTLEAPIDFDGSFLSGLPDDSPELSYEEPPEDASDEVIHSYRNGLPLSQYRKAGYRTHDEIARNKFPTPINERGLVDTGALIRQVKDTMVGDYDWGGNCDRHHVFWPRVDYDEYDDWLPKRLASPFRDLAINKIWIPRAFHNWIHAITLPPPMPSPEVMRESIDEWVVIRDFFASVKDTTQVMRIYDRERMRRDFTEEQEELIKDDLLRRLGGVIMHVKSLEAMPLEHWPLTFDMRVHAAAGQVGDLVLRGWQRRTKDVRRPLLDVA